MWARNWARTGTTSNDIDVEGFREFAVYGIADAGWSIRIEVWREDDTAFSPVWRSGVVCSNVGITGGQVDFTAGNFGLPWKAGGPGFPMAPIRKIRIVGFGTPINTTGGKAILMARS